MIDAMRQPQSGGIELSIVCPVTEYARDLETVHREFREVVARTGRRAEFLYVMDGPWTGAESSIDRIEEPDFPVRVLRMARGFGEATALQIGFERSRGRLILTIPDRPVISAEVLESILERLDRGDEVVVTRREPRSDALLNRMQARVFHGLVRRLVGQNFQDMACGARGFTAEAARKLELYGDQHRFIPVIAVRCGYEVVEIPGAQHPGNRGLRLYGPGVYVRRIIDILNIYFLTRFTRKPLRFFGLVGTAIGVSGFLICAALAVAKLALGIPLAHRPLLLLGVLLIVLGVQFISIGLVGEIIIFLSSRREVPAASESLPARGQEAQGDKEPLQTAQGDRAGSRVR